METCLSHGRGRVLHQSTSGSKPETAATDRRSCSVYRGHYAHNMLIWQLAPSLPWFAFIWCHKQSWFNVLIDHSLSLCTYTHRSVHAPKKNHAPTHMYRYITLQLFCIATRWRKKTEKVFVIFLEDERGQKGHSAKTGKGSSQVTHSIKKRGGFIHL